MIELSSTRSILTICFFLFVIAVLANQISTANTIDAQQAVLNSSTYVPYNGSKYGFKVQYPSNWNISEDASGVWFFSPVNETGNIRFESQPSLNLSLSKNVQAQLLLAKRSYKGFDVVSTNMTNLDGNPANRTDYKFKMEFPKFLGSDVVDYTAFQISSINGSNLYTVTYFAPPESFYIFLPIAEKMLSSMRIQ